MVSKDARVWSGVCAELRAALAVSLSAGKIWSLSRSTYRWVFLKFRRTSSWGSRRSGWSYSGGVSIQGILARNEEWYQEDMAVRVELRR